jgi:hypothetical protein
MNGRIDWLLTGLFLVASVLIAYASHAQEAKISVLNPRGQPPPIPLVSMAPRTGDLAARTVYFVDVRFMGGDVLLKEMQKVFAEKYPELKTEFRQKLGGYTEDDPKLWAEIKEKNGVMVMAIGH